ncbi:MAG: BspA family leucine-rich repeat surface protein [Coriobacteriia bacterium]|nr:BspA family leucine-rich repeat surface protein [Coriobacteriia bacterium]
MFYGCSGIVELDLSKFNTDKAVCNPNFEDLYNGNISAPGMFSECTRLTKINVHSEYDDDSYYNITGFSLNLGESGLANCNGDNVVWKNDGDTSWQETDSSYRIPYNSNIIWEGSDLSEGNIHTGTFYRSQNFDEKRVEVVSNDTSKGTVSEDGYGYINNVQIMLNNLESNSINLDNRKITATAKDENSRFAYWKIQIGDEDEFTMPNGYCETFFADDDLEITITAVFVSNEENGYVAFSNHQNGDKKEGTFTFYYGTADEASDFVPEGDTFVEVYPVYNNTSDYNLPSWYRKYQESWISGDNHPIPKFVNKVESNADTIFVNFDSSFKNFDELRSMSCWFMGALSATNEAVLYNPFALDSAEHFSGLDNINTSNIDNVAYMFGGSEFFNEIHGSKNETIYLKDFDKEGNIRNLSGIFANLPRLTNLTVDNCFNGMTKVTSTSKMFYNTIKLEKSNLNWLKTQNVEDMSYMFGNSVDGKPKEKLVEDNPFTLTLPENFVFSDNLYNLEGMFSGYAIYPKLIVDFSKIHTSENKVIRKANMSHMFQNCYWISSIEFKGTVPEIFSRGTDMSYMYKNCSNIKKATNGNDSAIPVPLQCVAYVINFNNMFDGCTSLEDYSLTREDKDFDIEYMQYMFSGCTSLKTVSLDSGYY